MPDVVYFFKAVLGGFVVAMPIGAIGALCMRRGLQGRWGLGLVTGIGAAVADAILAAGALFGLSLVTNYLLDNQGPARLIGGLFLLYLGIHMIRNRKPESSSENNGATDAPLERLREFTGALSTGFALTIVNPATLLGFVGVFAGLGLVGERPLDDLTNFLIVGGAFVGSCLWWLTLTWGSVAARELMSRKVIKIINTVLGVIVLVFGVVALISFVQMFI